MNSQRAERRAERGPYFSLILTPKWRSFVCPSHLCARTFRQNELRGLKKRCTELESAATMSQGEASGYARQLDALAKELQVSKMARGRAEEDMRQQVGGTYSCVCVCVLGGKTEHRGVSSLAQCTMHCSRSRGVIKI
jgi:hypothetical protein